MLRRLDSHPVWLSTAGAGVSWLHVRIDDRPKYYGYAPYRETVGISLHSILTDCHASVFPHFHAADQTLFDSIDVLNHQVFERMALQVMHHLMHVNDNAPVRVRCKPKRFDMRINQVPLLSPVGTHPVEGVCPADVYNRNPRKMSLVTGGAGIVGDGVLAKATDANVVFCQMSPYDVAEHGVVAASASNSPGRLWDRRTYRRSSYLLARLLANQGAGGATPVLERFHTPVRGGEKRWLEGLYVDTPEEWDDPYRYFGW